MSERLVLPKELREALNKGELTLEQLKDLIRIESQALGLSFEEAIQAAREDTLPANDLGTDVGMLIGMLPGGER